MAAFASDYPQLLEEHFRCQAERDRYRAALAGVVKLAPYTAASPPAADALDPAAAAADAQIDRCLRDIRSGGATVIDDPEADLEPFPLPDHRASRADQAHDKPRPWWIGSHHQG